ncbi:hypothetical protein Cantr_03415 [Candida viswanathii]|uniref:Uncharacterized protein n=1 Tax=Candida viswanathii TaxID=5486 RepID=A0A367YPG2_9ASCO|nr:hypothetical protein Cantr_03415 [Candida viswanathii]
MIKLILLLLFVRFIAAPIPNFHDLTGQENLPQEDLQALTFFHQVVDMQDWDPNRSLRYKRNIKRDYVDDDDHVANSSNVTFVAQGKEEKPKPKWHVGAGMFLNKENFSKNEKTFIRYESDTEKGILKGKDKIKSKPKFKKKKKKKKVVDYCSDSGSSSDSDSDDDGKLKWFKKFSIGQNETKDISIIPSSKIVSTNEDGTFFSEVGDLQRKYSNDSTNDFSMGSSGGATISVSCVFFVIYFLFQL